MQRLQRRRFIAIARTYWLGPCGYLRSQVITFFSPWCSFSLLLVRAMDPGFDTINFVLFDSHSRWSSFTARAHCVGCCGRLKLAAEYVRFGSHCLHVCVHVLILLLYLSRTSVSLASLHLNIFFPAFIDVLLSYTN